MASLAEVKTRSVYQSRDSICDKSGTPASSLQQHRLFIKRSLALLGVMESGGLVLAHFSTQLPRSGSRVTSLKMA